ncbi:MAG TPA: aldehyde dehydrogenase family protein [Candidatus Kryptonia bacterium]
MIPDFFDRSTGKLVGQTKLTSPADVKSILYRAREAQPKWQALPLPHRRMICSIFAAKLYEHKDYLTRLITQENGKPAVEVYTSEIIPSIDLVRYTTRRASKVLAPRRVTIGIPLLKTKKAFIKYEPHGVVGIISAWNYPLLLPVGQVVPALISGNAVIFKPSEYTPLVGDMVAELLWQSGVPEDVLNIIHGGAEVGSALVKSGVDKIFFTGSTQTGRKISSMAAESLTPVSLELGSKDAMIVLDDADLDATASGAIWGAFTNAGQTCVSVERCYVHEKIFDSFLQSLREKVHRLRVRRDESDMYDIGAIIHEAQFNLIKSHIDDAVRRGAKLVEGGQYTTEKGIHYITPAILTDVPPDSPLLVDETFGPVLPVIKFKSDDEAVRLANSSRFGLSASVWTADRKRGLKICDKLKAGAVVLNDVISYYGMSDGVVGGVKESGSGRVHGEEGLHEMVTAKYFEIERMRRTKKTWWYSYDLHTRLFFENAIDFLYSKNMLRKMRAIGKMILNFLRMKKI